jgi:Protein of unknown function (DUF3768)
MSKKQQRAATPAARPQTFLPYTTPQTSEIRSLNDAFRRTQRGGRIFVTAGVKALGQQRVDALMWQVSEFTAFDEANDPYAEHDFGSFEDGGEKFLLEDRLFRSLHDGRLA